jgi:hypothetical protein
MTETVRKGWAELEKGSEKKYLLYNFATEKNYRL